MHQPMWYFLTPSPSPSTFSVMNNLYNTEVDADDPETANEGDMQTEYSCL